MVFFWGKLELFGSILGFFGVFGSMWRGKGFRPGVRSLSHRIGCNVEEEGYLGPRTCYLAASPPTPSPLLPAYAHIAHM